MGLQKHASPSPHNRVGRSPLRDHSKTSKNPVRSRSVSPRNSERSFRQHQRVFNALMRNPIDAPDTQVNSKGVRANIFWRSAPGFPPPIPTSPPRISARSGHPASSPSWKPDIHPPTPQNPCQIKDRWQIPIHSRPPDIPSRGATNKHFRSKEILPCDATNVDDRQCMR